MVLGAGNRPLWLMVLANMVAAQAGVWVEVTQVWAALQHQGGLGSG